MFRLLPTLLCLLIGCTILAAPAPNSAWDRPIDPDHDCKFDIRDGKITVEMPGGDHELSPNRKRFNAPRLLRDFDGDFVMRVRVSGVFRPTAKAAVDQKDSFVAAGLLMIPADDNCIRLEYAASRRKGELHSCPAFRMLGGRIFNVDMGWEASWKVAAAADKEAHIYLSLERRGDFIYEGISPDGKQWIYSFKAILKDLPKKVKVGLAAYSTSTEPFRARFDEFKLIRAERQGREPGIVFEGKFTK